MVKTRIYELAKQLGVESRDILQCLQDAGVDGRNHMSTLEDSEIALAKRKLGGVNFLQDNKDTTRRSPDANASQVRQERPVKDESPNNERSGATRQGVPSAHRGEIRAIKSSADATSASKGWTRFDTTGRPVPQARPIRPPRPAEVRPAVNTAIQEPNSPIESSAPLAQHDVVAENSVETSKVTREQHPTEIMVDMVADGHIQSTVAEVKEIPSLQAQTATQGKGELIQEQAPAHGGPETGATGQVSDQGTPQEPAALSSAEKQETPSTPPASRLGDDAQGQGSQNVRLDIPSSMNQRPQGSAVGYSDRGPRPQGGTAGGVGRGPRPPGGAPGYADRGPRPQGGYQGGSPGYADRGPRPQGAPGSYADRGPRPQGAPGSYADRGPRPQGAPGSYADRGPRPQGAPGSYADRGPRPPGAPGSYADRGPRPQGSPSGYVDRGPRPQGGFQGSPGGVGDRGPRPQGGFGADRGPRPQGGGFGDRGPRPQGGYQSGAGGGYGDRGPRPAGTGYQGGVSGGAPGRRPGFGNKLVVPPPPAQVPQEKVTNTRFGARKPEVRRTENEAERQARARRNRSDVAVIDEERESRLRAKARGRTRRKGFSEEEFRERKKDRLEIPETIIVRELAKRMGVDIKHIMRKLIDLGIMASLNQEIDGETASIIAQEYGMEVVLVREQELAIMNIANEESREENVLFRPPIVTIMGHVDHGKTSLLDAIRETNVTEGEAGGITQHIGAYQVELKGKRITFLDTPGHAAFTSMRARGAQVTDIAILVVAADDGIMPQTVEAINHAKAANVPIIIAINKVDKPDANPDKVKQELTEHALVVEEWGGETIAVNVSALKRTGLEELLEMILLVADMKELKADPTLRARGTVVEAELDRGMGPVATVLVNNGTLFVGDVVIAGIASGRVRAMFNDKGDRVEEAGPSMPVRILGLSEVPEPGDILNAVGDDRLARQVTDLRFEKKRQEELKQTRKVTLDDLFSQIKEGDIKELKIVIKADVGGSVEAVQQSLEKLSTDEVRVNVIHGGVGAISESDVMLASASNAIIIGFNVRPDVNAKATSERESVDIRLYRVIYDAIGDVKAAMEGLLEPEVREVILGRAEVRATFKVPKVGLIAGSYVLSGKVTRNAQVRVLRDNIVIFEGKVESLKRLKDDAREVLEGYECGIGIERFNDVKEGDVLEVYAEEKIARHLE